MSIKQVITDGDKPIKVWTNELDAHSRKQLVNLLIRTSYTPLIATY